MNLFQKRVFFLTGATLRVYRGRKNPVPQQVFQDSPAGLSAFAAYLDANPRTPVYLLVDLAEEEFRAETIPHLFGPDRRALAANRQRRLFPGTPHAHALFQGRETGARRKDRVLFAAVLRPDILGRWLDPIDRRGIPLVGIYSLPMLSGKLLSHLRTTSGDTPAPRATGRAAGHVLLVHCNADGGLRQSFFSRGHLQVSRLARPPGAMPGPGDPHSPARAAGWILEEVEKIHGYLGALRLLSADLPLDVYLLGAPGTLARPDEAPDPSHPRYHFVDTAKTAQAMGLAMELAVDAGHGPTPDALFVGALLRAAPANHYATPTDIRHFRFAQMRMAMHAMGVLLLSAAIAWSAPRFADLLILHRQANLLESAVASIHETRRAPTGAAGAPGETPTGPSLKAAVETAARLRAAKTTPYPLFMALGAALDEEPALEIQAIEWRVGDGTNRADGPAWLAAYQVATIEGRITAFDGDYRRAMAVVEGFANRLSRIDPVERVEIIRQPLDVSSHGVLTGKAHGVLGGANFTLQVVVRNEEG